MLKGIKNRKITSILLVMAICAGLFAAAPLTASANDNTDRFDFYVGRAAAGGLIPSSLSGNLDTVMSESDLFDFVIQFAKAKCGVDTDAILSRARTLYPTEERAKAATANDLLGLDVCAVAGDGTLASEIDLYSSFVLFNALGNRLITQFSPLIYYANDPLPLETGRYNFQNVPFVVYHTNVMGELMAEIIGLSQGLRGVPVKGDDSVTRRQFAAFCYMFSTMSVPKDLSGKYSGGVSGDAAFDSFVEGILDKAITPGMTDEQKVKAIYDYMIYNFKHDTAYAMISGNADGGINPLKSTVVLAEPIMIHGAGVCDSFANTFRLLAMRLGFECNYVSGKYVNTDGSKSGHGWNQIKVNDEWFWIDVDVEGTVFHKGNYSEPLYYLFMKKDGEWVKNHDWERTDWSAADASKYPMEFMNILENAPKFKLPEIVAAQSSQAVIVNGKNIAFDAYLINGNNYFKLRDLAYVLSGTEKQFEVGWDENNNAISLTSGQPYTAVGGEMAGKGAGNKTAEPANSRIYLDGRAVTLTAYNIGGNNYFKLRDIGEAFNFSVTFDGAKNTVYIDTSKGYTPK